MIQLIYYFFVLIFSTAICYMFVDMGLVFANKNHFPFQTNSVYSKLAQGIGISLGLVCVVAAIFLGKSW